MGRWFDGIGDRLRQTGAAARMIIMTNGKSTFSATLAGRLWPSDQGIERTRLV